MFGLCAPACLLQFSFPRFSLCIADMLGDQMFFILANSLFLFEACVVRDTLEEFSFLLEEYECCYKSGVWLGRNILFSFFVCLNIEV